MGYRSEVTIIIVDAYIDKSGRGDLETTEEKWAMFLAEVAVKPETEFAWREISSGISEDGFGGNVELDKEKRRITINFPDIKWYEGYKLVNSYMALFHSVQPYEDYIDAIYLRIGEDTEDIEEKYYGSGYELASIQSHIEIN